MNQGEDINGRIIVDEKGIEVAITRSRDMETGQPGLVFGCFKNNKYDLTICEEKCDFYNTKCKPHLDSVVKEVSMNG